MMTLRTFQPADWDEVCRIYRQGMDSNLATFESEIPPYSKWDAGHLPFGRLVAVDDGKVAGWVMLSPFSARRCFTGVAEVSIYIADEAKRCGAGSLLLMGEIAASEQNGVWTLQSGIMSNNAPSLALHRKCGFREIGLREKIARDPHGEWRDMILMERRSALL